MARGICGGEPCIICDSPLLAHVEMVELKDSLSRAEARVKRLETALEEARTIYDDLMSDRAVTDGRLRNAMKQALAAQPLDEGP